MRRAHSGSLGAALLLALLLWLVLYPLALVLVEGLRGPEGWTLAHVREFVSRPTELRALWGSLWISLASVALAALIGIPLALLLARYDLPGGRVLGGLVALPAVLPPLVGVVAFLFLYGETGFIPLLLMWLFGLEEPPWRLQGPGAILLVHAYSMYVYFYLLVRAALVSLDASQLEAAASLGAGRWRSFRTVVIPHLRPALAGAALLTFMTALGSFSAPYVFGGGFRVMPTQIVATRLNGEDQLAMVQTASLSAMALLALLLFRSDPREVVGGGGRKGAGPTRIAIRRPLARLLAGFAGWGLATLLLLPHLTLVLVSFVPVGTWTTEPLPPAYTWDNYATLVLDPVRLRPLLNSLWLATVATVAAVAVALAGALLRARRATGARRAIEGLLALPWAVPGTVFAIALATVFSVREPLAGRFVLVGTLWILPLAYLVRNLPITSRAISAGVRALDPSLDEAAASLGAGRRRALLRVTLPLLRPALLAGASLAFVTAFGDFVTSIMLYTYDTRPISLEILSSLRQADVGVAAAYGVVLMLVSGAVFALGSGGQGRGGTPG
ncbi:MAG TPA: iron ABC transporter permease [Gemmatimonadales bacterium]|nr:iron ABC transporter permease [Gemmatimonadales bacterium]